MVFRVNPLGLLCVAVTYSCMCYADYVVTVHMIGGSMSYSVWGIMNIAFFNLVLGLMLLSHIRAMTCDPGIVYNIPSNQHDYSMMSTEKYMQQDGNSSWKVCTTCRVVRPPTTHHCRICGHCVRKMEHHCPWINNCIGENNQKYVLMFLFYVVLGSVYAGTMMSAYWLLHPRHLGHDTLHNKMFHTAVLASMCIMFSVFSLAVGYDRLIVIRNHYESLEIISSNSVPYNSLTTKEACYEVFGNCKLSRDDIKSI